MVFLVKFPRSGANIYELPFAISQWLLHFSSSPLEVMFMPNRDSVWLHTSLVDSLPVQVGIVRRGLLPNRIPPSQCGKLHNYRKIGAAERASQHLSLRYVAYLTNRLHHFSPVCFRGIWRGGWWWLSQRQLEKSFGRNGSSAPALTRDLLRNWQVSAVAVAQSGSPLTILDNNAGAVFGNFENRAESPTSNPMTSGSMYQRALGHYLNGAAFPSAPIAPFGVAPTDTDFGDSSTGFLRGPAQRNIDLALERSFPIRR